MNRARLLLVLLMVLAITSLAQADKAASLKLYSTETDLNKVLSNYFHVEPIVVTTVAQDCSITDDVITTFVVAKLANADPIKINLMRRQGTKWATIINTYNLNPEKLFTPVPASGFIPEKYQQVYREYHQARAGKKYSITLYDNNVRELANIKFLVDRFKFQPLNVMQRRSRGVSFIDMIGEKVDLSDKKDKSDD